MKPHLAILVAWQVQRRGRSSAGAGVLAGPAACAVGAFVDGPGSYLAWLNQLRQATWA